MVMNMRQNEIIKTSLCVLLAVLVVTAAGLAAALAMDDNAAPESRQAQIEPREIDPAAETESGIPNDEPQQTKEGAGEAPIQAVDAAVQPKPADTTTYALRTKDGYLQVYILETGEFFMETSILYRLLPESVQAQIDHGKHFDSEEELFGFLENYSS